MMPPQEELQWYKAFFKKVSTMRSHHWDKKRFISGASEKENRAGLEIDKLIREENKRISSLVKELENG